LIFALMFAAALPGLYWEQGPETAARLEKAGVRCIETPAARVDAWKRAGFCAAAADPAAYVKLRQPGVEYRPDVASATRAPWVTSNAWQILRGAGKPVYYGSSQGKEDLCAAEAFVYGARALIRADPSGLDRFGSMLRFLGKVDGPALEPRVNIGFVDDGSAEAGEVMNLMIRRNLLFRIVAAPDTRLDLNVRLGSPEFPRTAAANPSEFAALIRRKLTDAKRLLRIFGSEVVIGRLTGDGSQARVHLLNYGGKRLEGVHVRVAGAYRSARVLTPAGDGPAADLFTAGGATEFSVPALDAYAIIDLR
jgi:hypothetical protein